MRLLLSIAKRLRACLTSAQGALRLRLAVERLDGDVAFVRVDATDEYGTIEGTCNTEVSVSVEGGQLLAFGSSAQKSECSYLGGTFPLRYGRGLAVVRLNEDQTCTVRATACDVEQGMCRLPMLAKA